MLNCKYNVDYRYANNLYNPHNTCHTRYYVESKKYGMLLLETSFSTQGNMKKRGPGGNAKSSAAVGAGDAGVVEVVDDTEGQGRGKLKTPQIIQRKPK